MNGISIVIPTLNRATWLERTLQSVAGVVAGRADDVEVLVVDNGSTDRTPDIVGSFQEQFPRLDWRYVRDPMPGQLTGRHRGAREARGEILAFLDDDVLLAPTWLDALIDGFRDPAILLVGGPAQPEYELEPPPWLSKLWWEFEDGRSCGYLSLIDLGSYRRLIDPCLVWGLNFLIRRKALLEFGGFHPDIVPKSLQRFQGDGETGLCLKIRSAGHQALYHPEAAVTHMIPASRLTPEAFELRGFYQGVCDSFTRIRSEGTVSPASGNSWKDIFRPIKRKLHRAALLRSNNANAIRELNARAQKTGYEFHRNEIRNDVNLLAWVLQPDYFDYRLPSGWERFLPNVP